MRQNRIEKDSQIRRRGLEKVFGLLLHGHSTEHPVYYISQHPPFYGARSVEGESLA